MPATVTGVLPSVASVCLLTQVAQLSQRGCAMLRVTEYCAKSLKIIESGIPLESLSAVSCSHFRVNMAMSYIISLVFLDKVR